MKKYSFLGKVWIKQMVISAFLLPSLVCGTAFFINFIAIYYHASRAIPFTTMVSYSGIYSYSIEITLLYKCYYVWSFASRFLIFWEILNKWFLGTCSGYNNCKALSNTAVTLQMLFYWNNIFLDLLQIFKKIEYLWYILISAIWTYCLSRWTDCKTL